MISDEELVRSMADGDQAAFEVFVHRYHRPLQGYLERMLQDADKAEDLVQDTFVRLLRRLQQGEIPGQIRPWLYRVALNLCRDYWRSSGYRSEMNRLAQPPEHKDTNPSIVEIYERQETRTEILQSLNSLPESQREIVILRFYQDLKLQEIAEVLDMPLSTVKTNLYNALKKLKKRLMSRNVNYVESEGTHYA